MRPFARINLSSAALRRGILVSSLALLTLVGWWLLFHGEDYCWWWPDIDTQFASGFDRAGWERINVGMSERDVVSLIGEPYFKESQSEGQTWYYSKDGALGHFGDKAWFSYEVLFTDKCVVGKRKQIYCD